MLATNVVSSDPNDGTESRIEPFQPATGDTLHAGAAEAAPALGWLLRGPNYLSSDKVDCAFPHVRTGTGILHDGERGICNTSIIVGNRGGLASSDKQFIVRGPCRR